MIVRRASLDDAESISALIVPLAVKFITHEFTDQGREKLLNSLTPDAIRDYMNKGYRFHVAEDPGLVGVAATRDNCHLYHLFVAEAAQRQGIASKLWAIAKAACVEAGNVGIYTVNSSRHAVGLYEKLGFRRADEWCKDGISAIRMRLDEKAT